MKKRLVHFFTLVCTFVLCIGLIGTAAATHITATPNRASDYLEYYNAWANTGAKREVIISFDVNATGVMDLVGANCIVVQEKNGSSWAGVATYYGSVSNGMLAADADAFTGNITYMGTAGKDYRALVTVYAGNSTGDDSRTVTTNTVRAR
ncbi:hypothetical protein SDC9_51422 [bioreactor metagenome]|uniref:Uncharacterized protein n=1 Tax=bioreactor metagenome TaxID=1076179 RepID=A0A644WMJ4_9ZZZZ|nr:hypothetical protein [Pseudoflavonifractor sp.]